ncbi:hypothetical protein FRX31_007378 [Thalictrum thalictroides]|uniref:Uncharacterized protein n=1 Tax=Thalictrum thalictroides TaxID=46969 RepID=A0A7J6X2C6_THATH|nr:hypothetical protein FRX31_007378 [Thalictrum thalictroides]
MDTSKSSRLAELMSVVLREEELQRARLVEMSDLMLKVKIDNQKTIIDIEDDEPIIIVNDDRKTSPTTPDILRRQKKNELGTIRLNVVRSLGLDKVITQKPKVLPDSIGSARLCFGDISFTDRRANRQLSMKKELVFLYVCCDFDPKTGSHDHFSSMETFLIWAILTGKRINLQAIILAHMSDVVKPKKSRTGLPYGMALTQLFHFFKLPLKHYPEIIVPSCHDKYSSSSLKRMNFSLINDIWVKAIGEDMEEDHIEHEASLDPTQAPSVAQEPLMTFLESGFTAINARLDNVSMDIKSGFDNLSRHMENHFATLDRPLALHATHI